MLLETPTGPELAPPTAASLIEALRNIGYSTATAVADLIDNSISADAHNIWLWFWWAGHESFISILDDGIGMEEEQLSRAMHLGSRNPLAQRGTDDLGRFGMGLKTASFSQCRRVTVGSRKNGRFAVRCWDLNHVARVGDWQLLTSLSPESETHFEPLENLEQGTLVLWECLDRIVDDVRPSDRRAHDAFLELTERVESHIAMVFHRFLEGTSPRLRIFINGDTEEKRVKPWDPFLRAHPATVPTPIERITTYQGIVQVQGFVLPNKDLLETETWQIAAGTEGWTAQQGFYVYRNQRIVVAGGWLGLGIGRAWTREECYGLARLRLDIPNTADAEWKIDIKKSTAHPPPSLHPRLRDLADYVRRQARQVYVHRTIDGQRSSTSNLERAWQVVECGDDVTYRINRDHTAIKQVLDQAGPLLRNIEAMLRILEKTVPVQRVWLDTCEKRATQDTISAVDPPEGLEEVAAILYLHLVRKVGLQPDEAYQRLLNTEPFQNFPTLLENLLRTIN